MATFQKHHYGPWTTTPPEGAAPSRDKHICYSKCVRCGLPVKCGLSTSFWVNGKWIRKRPPCETR